MTLTVTPSSELDAVNLMLAAVGSKPVNSLDGSSGLIEAGIAHGTLSSVSREVQTRGWWFNRSFRTELAVDANGNIPLPSNTLKVSPSKATAAAAGESKLFTMRGTKLFDVVASAYDFTAPVFAELVILLDYTDLPESMRRYIAVRAARLFTAHQLGDEASGSFTATHEQEAWQIVEDEQSSSTPPSFFHLRMQARLNSLRSDPQREAANSPQRPQ